MPLSAAPAAGRLGVLGWPVAHSRSPQMQRAAFAELGLRGWSYQRLPAPPELFEEIVRALGPAGFRGANVTLPHKQAALALADAASDTAREIGAANTLTFRADGTIEAENTDAPGLLHAIGGRSAGAARADPRRRRDGARGGLGAAWGRCAGQRLEPQPRARRDPGGGAGVAAVERPGAAELLVNATIVGMDERNSLDEVLSTLGLSSDVLARYEQVVDFAYSRSPTVLLKAARELGAMTVDGLDILVAQGGLSFELWTGRTAPLGAMRRAAAGG